MGDVLLHIASLSHAYDGHPVLADVDLAVRTGGLTAVLGSSGVGKTTLLRAVAGFLTPDTGTISLGGRPLVIDGREVIPAEQRQVGMVFQDHALFPHMTTAENIAFGLDPLAPRPSILLLDEPFASLDAELRRGLSDELRGILRREEVAALLVTHDHRAALAWCDQVAILAADPGTPGRLHQHAVPQEVYSRPATEAAARLTGDVVALDGEARGETATTALGEVPLMAAREGTVRLILRPEQLRFAAGAEGDAEVIHRAFEGPVVRLTVSCSVGTMRVETTAGAAPETGTRGTLSVVGEAWALDESEVEEPTHGGA